MLLVKFLLLLQEAEVRREMAPFLPVHASMLAARVDKCLEDLTVLAMVHTVDNNNLLH